MEVSFDPLGCLERFGERKMIGSMFSLLSSSSKVVAFLLLGGERVDERARDLRFRFMFWLIVWLCGREDGMGFDRTIGNKWMDYGGRLWWG